ncbi:VanZ family protein [Chryseobacterium carnipullorum]|uniref:Predicted integral membrane protein n=1 Tax=Chryseobacterium carnipullorum TaxID=1124835 RepID=A0A376DPA0_CHRCU|nr:VanZ family protein [Chryseobacterium carnipullorum]AZA48659.1 VanZ family protein [Chryseobacterium carnipullorum]AZA63574.1 VanZ family protein [Chryseobacterium carnipullorum]STC92855.1 Predicted integral membrane protein [Chryseobacterium carnipullorum]HBV16277.1 teicoplanin resistance protein VanZ [Chryseobacterium carnipullorum]
MLKKFYKIIIVPYTLTLLYLMFLGMGRFQYEDNQITVEPILSTLEFIHNTIGWKEIVVIVLGNILMFIPFGFLGWIFPQLKDLKRLLYVFVSSIVIVEALQYFTRMGIFEVDDIILNTFGVYLGWLLCRLVEKKFSRLVL